MTVGQASGAIGKECVSFYLGTFNSWLTKRLSAVSERVSELSLRCLYAEMYVYIRWQQRNDMVRFNTSVKNDIVIFAYIMKFQSTSL